MAAWKGAKLMLVTPRATEKTYRAQTQNTYVFNVPANASKQAVARAVAEQFGVTVTSVRILIRKGKATRFSRGKHAYPGTTYRQDKKLAYVTLKDGDKIRVFDELGRIDFQLIRAKAQTAAVCGPETREISDVAFWCCA